MLHALVIVFGTRTLLMSGSRQRQDEPRLQGGSTGTSMGHGVVLAEVKPVDVPASPKNERWRATQW